MSFIANLNLNDPFLYVRQKNKYIQMYISRILIFSRNYGFKINIFTSPKITIFYVWIKHNHTQQRYYCITTLTHRYPVFSHPHLLARNSSLWITDLPLPSMTNPRGLSRLVFEYGMRTSISVFISPRNNRYRDDIESKMSIKINRPVNLKKLY